MNRVGFFLVGAAAFVLASTGAAVAVPYSYATTRWDAGGPAFWGNLTWTSGTGGISWNLDPPSDDDAPLNGPSPGTDQADASLQYYAGTSLAGGPAVNRFTSAPLPKTLHLNVSRNIQFELAFHNDEGTNTCNSRQYYYHEDPDLEVRLRLGERTVAGLLESDYASSYIEWWYFVEAGGTPPGDPDGYCVSRFAVASELSVLEAGSVLTLDLIIHSQDRPYTLGLRDDHRSTIRFPLYDAEEILFRNPTPATSDPEGAGGDAEEAPSAGSADAALSAGLGFLGFLAGFARATRTRRPLAMFLVLALLAVAFGGCVGSKSRASAPAEETLRGRLENTFVSGGDLSTGIVGRIFDDLHVPIAGVHVSLLGLTNFTETDSNGRFKFLDLAPGIYRLRFDKKEYNGFEAEVEVKAGKISRPSIMLFLSDPKERDRRPHSHDYWAADEKKREIMNRLVPTGCPDAGGTDCQWTAAFHVPPKEGSYASVLPGTVDVEVVLRWDPEATQFGRLGLAVGHNGDPWSGGYNRSVFAPRGPGEAFHIAANWEMADAGHQPYSSWTFQLYLGDMYTPNGYVDTWVDPRTAPPQITAQITVHRGISLPLEPGHRDWWVDKAQLDVFKNLDGYYYGCLWPGAVEPALPCTSNNQASWQYLHWYGGKMVPPGTGRIEFEATLNHAPLLDMGWHLYYKPANIPYPDWSEPLVGYRDAGSPTASGTKLSLAFPVKADETDPEYAKVSNWAFVLRAENGDNAWAEYMTSLSNLGAAYPYLTVKGSAKALHA